MLSLFKNINNQNEFDNKGYFITPLLNQNDVTELFQYYAKIDKTYINDRVFHSTFFIKNPDYYNRIVSKLKDIILPKIDPILNKYKIIAAGFIVKEPSPNGIIPPHQDWTFVNENKYYSINFWIPLQDVNIDNGSLGFIENSKDMIKPVRGSPSPGFKTILGQANMELFPYMDIKSLKAGEALIYDSKTIHGSSANLTKYPRIAVAICLTFEIANLYHWYLSPEDNSDTIIKYKVNENFFSIFNNDKLYEYYTMKQYPDKFAQKIDEEKLDIDFPNLQDFIKNITNIKSNKWNEKLANLIKDYNPDNRGLRPDLQL